MVSGTGVTISGEELDAIAAYDQLFWEHGHLPTVEKVAEKTGIRQATIEKYWKKDSFRNALIARGLDLDQNRAAGLLSIEQLNLANMLLNSHDTRSVREKLKEAGVTSQKYHAWLRTPAFRDYLAMRGEQLFKSVDHEAYESLIGAVRGGDTRAIQLFFEMRGIYNPKMQIDINVNALLVSIVEVVSRHVRDPQTLQAIANDLESLNVGQAGGRSIPAPIIEVPATELSFRGDGMII